MMYKIFSYFFVLCLFSACSSNSENVVMKSLNGSWNKKTAQTFNYNIKDVQNPKNIIFVVRNNADYPYSNLRLIATITNLKSKQKVTDTLNYILAKPNGEWIGSGFGNTKETLFQYKTDFKFPENGTYSIKVIHAMRIDNLKGLEDIGIKIESVKP